MMGAKIKVVPLQIIVHRIKGIIRTWYQKKFKKAVLKIKLVDATK